MTELLETGTITVLDSLISQHFFKKYVFSSKHLVGAEASQRTVFIAGHCSVTVILLKLIITFLILSFLYYSFGMI